MAKKQKDERTAEERARDRQILHTRGAAITWAMQGSNMVDYVRPEYHRRMQRGEALFRAWRRAIWVCFKRHCHE